MSLERHRYSAELNNSTGTDGIPSWCSLGVLHRKIPAVKWQISRDKAGAHEKQPLRPCSYICTKSESQNVITPLEPREAIKTDNGGTLLPSGRARLCQQLCIIHLQCAQVTDGQRSSGAQRILRIRASSLSIRRCHPTMAHRIKSWEVLHLGTLLQAVAMDSARGVPFRIVRRPDQAEVTKRCSITIPEPMTRAALKLESESGKCRCLEAPGVQ